jgi:protein NirF
VSSGRSGKKLREIDRSLTAELKTVAAMLILLAGLLGSLAAEAGGALRGTGDLAIVIQRADGSVQILDTTTNQSIGKVGGLGDLSHASAVYSRDGRYAYVFGRDGGLSKVDLLTATLVGRTVQAGNSIGGAISQDGRLVAVSNYTPGGVKVFDADSLALLADIPAQYAPGQLSKVLGLVDAPGQRFVFSLWDAGQIWIADMSDPAAPRLQKFSDIGRNPYDAFITADGRYYLAGLFGEAGLALLDLWHPEQGVRRILGDYGRGEAKLPVYKMPHLEGWAVAGTQAFVPAIGRHEVLVIDMLNWQQVGRIAVHGQPVFVMSRPDGRQVWVNFACRVLRSRRR